MNQIKMTYIQFIFYTIALMLINAAFVTASIDCRAKVIKDINDFETYKAKLQTTVSPDFLTTLTEGK